ncbi:MAG: hypothetical protein DELT_00518 [Desulfovibrio sp.]
MQHLNSNATRIFKAILERLGESEYCKIENSTVFMAVNVDRISPSQVSIAHNSEQNGDFMRDPDMTFWLAPDDNVYPCTYQNDYLGLYQEAVTFVGDMPHTYKPNMQADLAKFADHWLDNIANQQEIAA